MNSCLIIKRMATTTVNAPQMPTGESEYLGAAEDAQLSVGTSVSVRVDVSGERGGEVARRKGERRRMARRKGGGEDAEEWRGRERGKGSGEEGGVGINGMALNASVEGRRRRIRVSACTPRTCCVRGNGRGKGKGKAQGWG